MYTYTTSNLAKGLTLGAKLINAGYHTAILTAGAPGQDGPVGIVIRTYATAGQFAEIRANLSDIYPSSNPEVIGSMPNPDEITVPDDIGELDI